MRLHLIDGTDELYRAFYSKRPSHVVGGRDVKALLSFASSMLSLLHDPAEAVDHVAVAFDNPIRSFRTDLFDDYKSDEGVPPELRALFDPVEATARALGMCVWSMDAYEADDALATAATRFAGEVEQVRILTPDKDLGQVLDGARIVQVDRVRNRVIDEAWVLSQRGVRPSQIPDYLALTGDAADGIPGLPGFGERTAARLLGRFARIEDIPLGADAWPTSIRGAAGLARTLGERREDALLYRRLATLAHDVPLRESLADVAWRGVPRDDFVRWCDAHAVTDLRERPQRWA
jgi:5'-3' exonuclease